MTSFIFNQLPKDIIREKIIPYTYNFVKKELLVDIRSFKKDYDLVDSIYSYSYKDVILLNDIEKCIRKIDNKNTVHSIMEKVPYKPFFSRHFILKNKSLGYTSVCQKKFFDSKKNINSKIRLIWGLMTPSERTYFFNLYILDEEPY
jgi:hypothetical protein